MVEYISLAISIVAVIVASSSFVFNYRRTRKTEELKLCMDISGRVNDARSKINETGDKLNSNTTDHQLIEMWERDYNNAILVFLNNWEFFSFLINNKEIHEKKY